MPEARSARCSHGAGRRARPPRVRDSSGRNKGGHDGTLLVEGLPAGRARGRRHHAVPLVAGAHGGLVSQVRATRCVRLHGSRTDLRRARPAVGGIRRVAAGNRARARVAGRDHDAQHPAIPGGTRRGAAGRLRGGQRQPALYAARTRAPDGRLGRRGDRDPRELRGDAAAGHCPHADPARDRHGAGGPARLCQGRRGELRRAAHPPHGAAVLAPRAPALP